MKKWISIGVFAMLSGSGLLFGQRTEIRFHHIGLEEGLSHSLVSSVAEDSLGFLWFGTQDGLNRYDGYGFHTYYKGNSNRAPSDSWISRLYVDRANQMWIWYTGKGIERYDPFSETFHQYFADSLSTGSISSTSIVTGSQLIYNVFMEDSDGSLWIGTDHGLNRYLREEDAFEVFLSDPEDPRTLSNNEIITLSEDREGYVWI